MKNSAKILLYHVTSHLHMKEFVVIKRKQRLQRKTHIKIAIQLCVTKSRPRRAMRSQSHAGIKITEGNISILLLLCPSPGEIQTALGLRQGCKILFKNHILMLQPTNKDCRDNTDSLTKTGSLHPAQPWQQGWPHSLVSQQAQ